MNIDPHDYNISIRRTEVEGEICYEARVKELPDLAEYGDSFEEAYALAIDSIETTMEILAEKGRNMPQPSIPADDYSGRVTLRLPKSLHRALAQAADDEDASLNQHLVNVLTYYSGFAAGASEKVSPWKPLPPTHPSSQRKLHLKVVSSSQPALQTASGWR